jgi:hypothetical protein
MAAQVEGVLTLFLNQGHRGVLAMEQALQDKVFQAVQEALQDLLIFLSLLVALLFKID